MDVFVSNWRDVLDGFWTTLQLFVVSGLGALLLGSLLAAARVSPVPVLRGTAATYVTLFRNTPLLVLILLTYYGLPELGIRFSFFVEITLAMGLYTAAFVAEALRSGVNAVPVGQAEAARSIGLPFSQSMTQVVLPQAYRAVVPPLASVLIALAKNTSLAAAFGLADATFRMKGLLNDHPADRPSIFFGFALGYIIIVEAISLSAGMLERRWEVER
jgi:glutamate transport system permease protein